MRVRIALLIAAALILALAFDAARVALEGRLRARGVPLYLQRDYTEVVCMIAGRKRTVASSGCGAVCVAMAAAALTGSRETPQTLFEWAYDTGLYFGEGLGHDALSRLAERCGLRGEWLLSEAQPVREALAAGHPVVAHMGAGAFSQNGHYILLRGIGGDDEVFVNDPYSPERSARAWPLETILREVKTGRAFMKLAPDRDRAVRVL